MPRPATVPSALSAGPFRGSEAVACRLITWRMLDGSAWRRLFPNIYVHRELAVDHRMWCAAAGLALPGGTAIGGLSAACLWGIMLLTEHAPVSVVAPRDHKLHPLRRVAVHYTTLADTDVVTRDGMRVTTPERTIFDLGRRAGRADALVVLDAMLHRHLVDSSVLRQMMRTRSGWPRMDRLAALLPLADPGSESPMETRLRLVLVDARVPPSAVQYTVRDSNGAFVGRVDLAWPEVRLAVEYDGDHHREPHQFRRDVDRLNALRLAGWTVLRFTAADVLRKPAETARMVSAALTQLGWRSST